MWDYLCSLPPSQHSKSKAGPNACPDEVTFTQAEQGIHPKPNRAHEGEPIEPHHEHEEYRNGPHSLSSHRHVVLHQRKPANSPQYVWQEPAKAAPASSIDSAAIRSFVFIRHLPLLK